MANSRKNKDGSVPKRKVRVAYLVSHPIQYQAPLLRRISQEPDIELTVLFASNFSVHQYVDKGFGVDVKWDVPLVDGYDHEFLPVIWDKRRTGRATQFNYGIFSRLLGNKRQAGFDVLWVHGYSTLNALQGMLVAKMLGIPVLLRAESRLTLTEKTGLKSDAKTLFFDLLRHFVDGVLPIGSSNAAYWRHYLGEGVPQFLMPYAVDNDYFQKQCREASSKRNDLLKQLNLDESRPIILFASKLQNRKHCGDLLEAYLKLSPGKGLEPEPYLVIVGDGEERNALEQRAMESGFSSVRFCGFRNQSELPAFFNIATVFVLPSLNEPWGLIVNEVMNAGKAVIVSDDVGCQPDLISDGVEGCVFPAGNIAALTDALRRVLGQRSTADTMGKRALERINQWNYEEDVRGLRRGIAFVTRRVKT
jgi:glycosyltransferase involved in cell wall biosynthesis